DETHDNIVAYWVPQRLPAPGQALDFSYELLWQGDDAQRPPSAWVAQTRAGYGYTRLDAQSQARQPKFVLDFTGPALQQLPPDAPVQAVVSTGPGGRVIEAVAYPNPELRGWRLSLRVERDSLNQPLELRAYLRHRDDTVSETWTHLLLPQ
ncbi:MAG: glucan biosynthesis protein, partial [Hydrogenophaga sp.]|nr:glucan biosynthesis protein [Hydrogenophaga sp.]